MGLLRLQYYTYLVRHLVGCVYGKVQERGGGQKGSLVVVGKREGRRLGLLVCRSRRLFTSCRWSVMLLCCGQSRCLGVGGRKVGRKSGKPAGPGRLGRQVRQAGTLGCAPPPFWSGLSGSSGLSVL